MNMKINYLIILGLFCIQDMMGQSDFGLAPILRIDDNTLMEKFKSPPGGSSDVLLLVVDK